MTQKTKAAPGKEKLTPEQTREAVTSTLNDLKQHHHLEHVLGEEVVNQVMEGAETRALENNPATEAAAEESARASLVQVLRDRNNGRLADAIEKGPQRMTSERKTDTLAMGHRRMKGSE